MIPRHQCHEPQGPEMYCPYCHRIGTSSARRCVERMRFQRKNRMDVLWFALALLFVGAAFYVAADIYDAHNIPTLPTTAVTK